MEQEKLKLFIWKGVCRNYTDGYAIAFAKTKEEAIKTIAENSENYEKELYLGELYTIEPEVYTKEYGFLIHGEN